MHFDGKGPLPLWGPVRGEWSSLHFTSEKNQRQQVTVTFSEDWFPHMGQVEGPRYIPCLDSPGSRCWKRLLSAWDLGGRKAKTPICASPAGLPSPTGLITFSSHDHWMSKEVPPSFRVTLAKLSGISSPITFPQTPRPCELSEWNGISPEEDVPSFNVCINKHIDFFFLLSVSIKIYSPSWSLIDWGKQYSHRSINPDPHHRRKSIAIYYMIYELHYFKCY